MKLLIQRITIKVKNSIQIVTAAYMSMPIVYMVFAKASTGMLLSLLYKALNLLIKKPPSMRTAILREGILFFILFSVSKRLMVRRAHYQD